MQVTSSFKSLVARNPDLCLNFIKEVSLCLSNPSLPEATDPDSNSKLDADFDAPEPSTAAAAVPSLGKIQHTASSFSLQVSATKLCIYNLNDDMAFAASRGSSLSFALG